MDHWLALERICNLLEDDSIPVSTILPDMARKVLPRFVQRWIAPAGIEYTKFHSYYPGDKTDNDINIYAYKDKIIVLKGDLNNYTKYNVTTVTKIARLPMNYLQKPNANGPLRTRFQYEEESSITNIYTYFDSPAEKLYEKFEHGSNEIVLRWFFRIGEFAYWIKMDEERT